MESWNQEAGMAGEGAGAQPVVSRIGADGWRAWREIRRAALADAPDSFPPQGRSWPHPRLSRRAPPGLGRSQHPAAAYAVRREPDILEAGGTSLVQGR
jgi:hypothetical protein